MIYSLTYSDMEILFSRIKNDYKTYGTVDLEGDLVFSRLDSYDSMTIGRSVKSPKEFLIKREENVLAIPDPDPTAVFGVMSCDLKGLYIMDKQIYGKDPFYTLYRDNSLMVNFVCTTPCNTGFCSSFGGPLLDQYQIQVVPLGDERFVVYAQDTYDKYFEGFNFATEQEIERVNDIINKFMERQEKHNVQGIENRIKWNSPLWDKFAKICIQCGACNYSCPTCYCIDLNDSGDERVKEWDSCILSGFTRTSAGNPRYELSSRLRQRFYHKFVYYKRSKGEYLCTGCNRCTDDCPVDIEIKEVIDHDYGSEPI